MNVTEIGTRVKRQFGDEAGAQINDSDIIRWVNDAMTDIAINNNLLQMKGSANTVAGTQAYNLPTDLLTLRSVSYQGLKLKPYSLEEADSLYMTSTNSQDTPVGYWLFAKQINLFPIPSTSVASALSIYYTRSPVAVTAVGDTPEIPVQYHPRIVEYCIAQAAESDDNLAQYQLKMSQFKQGIDSLKDNQDWEERDFYPQISVTPRDYGEDWYG